MLLDQANTTHRIYSPWDPSVTYAYNYYVCCLAICTLVVIYTVYTYALLSAQPAALQSVEFAIHLIIVN